MKCYHNFFAKQAQVDWQAQAVKDAFGRQLSVVSGGPGTGKTYTVARLLVALQAVSDTFNHCHGGPNR